MRMVLWRWKLGGEKKYGGDGIEFIEKLFDETHYVVKSYNAQGSVLLFSKEMGVNLRTLRMKRVYSLTNLLLLKRSAADD